MTSNITDRRYGVSEGLAAKMPCRVVATTNLTLSGLQTIDSVLTAEGDRVLLTGQTDGTKNGAWNASARAWTRAKDFDGSFDIVNGTQIFVTSGSTYGRTIWYVNTADDIEIGTTSLTISQFSLSTITLPFTVSQGGTGKTTAAAARNSTGLNIEAFTGHGDSIYTILTTDRVVGTNATFTASRNWTLPAASAVNPGQPIVVADFYGGVTAINTLVIVRAGTDTINGGSSVTIDAAYGAFILWSDGVSKWGAAPTGNAASSGVTSLGSLTGALGLGTGLTTSGSNIVLSASKVTNTLGADVALNNTATFFDGPSCAQGTNGTWLAVGQITTTSSAAAGGDLVYVKLWDGTTVIASTVVNPTPSGFVTVHLSGIITSPASNIKMSVKNFTVTTQSIRFNASGASTDSTLTVVRIA